MAATDVPKDEKLFNFQDIFKYMTNNFLNPCFKEYRDTNKYM